MSTNQIEPFSVFSEVPLQLHIWWNDLGDGSKKIVERILGGLVNLLNIKPRTDIIEALIPFWDPTRNVFRFADFELTPTLEEIAGYAGLNGKLRGRYLLSPRPVYPHGFLDLLHISQTVQNGDFSKGYCALQFLYQRYGAPQGFEAPNLGLTHDGNRNKWEAGRILAFITTFLGIVVCPRKDQKIEIGHVGMSDVAIKKTNSTVVPLVLSEIYRALTICREGGNFFQGCNLLLQLWMQEHLFHWVGYMNHGLIGENCISGFEKRAMGIVFPEGVEAWLARLRSLTADQIEWAFGWLPDTEAIYTTAEECHIPLMGVRSIQPYAPYRVLRQLGRFQVIPTDEDLTKHAIELSPGATFPEKTIRKLWNECRFLEPKTMVRELAKGEVDPKYNAWFGKRFQIRQRHAKRAHVQQFTDDSQEQWGWLAKEENYRAELGKLKQQIASLTFENSVQAAEDQGEKNRLAQENERLKAQIRKMRVAADNQQRSRSDERLIKGLKNEINECRDELGRSENVMAELKEQWNKISEERHQYLQQLKKDHAKIVANLQRKVVTLEDKVVKQARSFETESEHCYDLLAQMEVEVQQLQNQHFQDSQALKTCSNQIKRLLTEKKQTRDRIVAIAHAILRRCRACRDMTTTTFFQAAVIYVKRTMNELEQLEHDLAPRRAAGPNDAPQAPRFEALEYA